MAKFVAFVLILGTVIAAYVSVATEYSPITLLAQRVSELSTRGIR